MGLRDHLPGAGQRKQAETVQYHRADHCELMACRCGNRGAPDVAIQDRGGNVMGYVCQEGYLARLVSVGKDQWSCWKETGAKLNTPAAKPADKAGLHGIAELVSEFDRYAESMADREDDVS